jgi:hypothetical protein|eukprot:TRINITY_DN15336_c0_g1_i1.p1 TRINITY_DN15336_c0_g1~~TRINITY_DN15336_c0_g1_i1.p1  ORF type:complete len:283 (+),score=57.89 TRINITY_DN15336_c0_g1_i1:68-916(+)
MGQSLEMCRCLEPDATKKETMVQVESVQGLRENDLCEWGEELVETKAPVSLGVPKNEKDVSEQRVVSLSSACMMAGDNIEELVETEKTGDHFDSDSKSTGSSSLHDSFGDHFSPPRSPKSIGALLADDAIDAFRAVNKFHPQNAEFCGTAVDSGRDQANIGDADKRSFAHDENEYIFPSDEIDEEAADEMGALTLQTPQGSPVRSRSRLCFGNGEAEKTASESDPAEIAAELLLLRQKIVELRAEAAAEELFWLPDGTLSPCSTDARFGEFRISGVMIDNQL